MKGVDRFCRRLILFVPESTTLLILKSTSLHLKYARISQMQRLILCNWRGRTYAKTWCVTQDLQRYLLSRAPVTFWIYYTSVSTARASWHAAFEKSLRKCKYSWAKAGLYILYNAGLGSMQTIHFCIENAIYLQCLFLIYVLYSDSCLFTERFLQKLRIESSYWAHGCSISSFVDIIIR